MVSNVSVYLDSHCPDISRLANRLGGFCAEQKPISEGIEQVFEFQLESRADQFFASVVLFDEVISVGSPVPKVDDALSVEGAIALSKLCECGVTTMHDCGAKKCEVMG